MQGIDQQLTALMKQYSEDVSAEIEEALTKIGKEAAAMLRSGSPRHTGKYAKGWRSDISKDSGSIEVIVHESTKQAALTHLLERGHKTRGGRHFVAADPHIQPVREWADAEALKAIEKAVAES